MDAYSIALMAKIARKEAGRVVPEKGDTGPRGERGANGRDGINGTNGVNGKDGRDGADGKDGVSGKDGKPGKDGKDANAWHLTFEEPDEDFGKDGDFALNGQSSSIYRKSGNKWDFIVHLKAEVPRFQMQPPAVISESRIESIIQRIAADKPDVYYTATDYTANINNDVILADGAITITLPSAVGNAGFLFRIKNISPSDVTVDTNGGNIDGTPNKILNQQYYAIDVVSDGANWNIL